MTEQEIFDRVVHHLAKQRVLAHEDGSCKYRDKHGNMCAVGCLIPDDLYRDEMEGDSVRDLANRPEMEKFFSGMRLDLLIDLQFCHDCNGAGMLGRKHPPLPQWEKELYRIAETFGLDDKVIEEYSWDS